MRPTAPHTVHTSVTIMIRQFVLRGHALITLPAHSVFANIIVIALARIRATSLATVFALKWLPAIVVHNPVLLVVVNHNKLIPFLFPKLVQVQAQ